MSAEEHDGHSRSEDLRSYATGFGLAVVLTVLAFAAAITQVFGTYGTYGCIVALGFVQVIVHLKYFLHLDLSKQKREDVQLILFTVLLIGLMACGTLWVLSDLMARMR